MKVRYSLKGKWEFLLYILILSASILLLQSCTGTKGRMQNYVDNYLQIINDLKNPTRVGIAKNGANAIIAYRRSGFTDIDNAERAKNFLLEGIRLDSITLQHIMTMKSPDRKTDEITNNLLQGVKSSIEGNILFAENYSRAKDQNIEERRETILNVRPGMRYLAEGLSSIVTSMENLLVYIKDNNLEGTGDLSRWHDTFKLENDNIKGFLRN